MLTPFERWTLLLNMLALPLLFLLGLTWLPASIAAFPVISLFAVGVLLSIILDWQELKATANLSQWLKWRAFEWIVLLVSPPLILEDSHWVALLAIRQFFIVSRLFLRWQFGKNFFEHLLQKPAKLLVMSFILVIMTGTFTLMLPGATTAIGQLPFLDALFTSTSATCVTGLIVKDTPNDFTLFGQIVILILIQIGGLGLMTISSFIIWMTGKRLGLRSQSALSDILDEPTPTKVLNLLRVIVISSLSIEAIGALILYLHWSDPAQHVKKPLFYASFHAISAFCNAGFALWSDSLVRFQSDAVVNLTVVSLILLGGLGFPILANLIDLKRLKEFIRHVKQTSFLWAGRLYIKTLPLNSKIVFLTQGILLSISFLLFFGLEYHHTLAHLAWPDKMLASLFQAVTLRTAGFNTVDFTNLTPASVLSMMFFMFIGGAAGGTAGGIKINTLAVLYLSISSYLKGRKDVEAFGRTIPQETIFKATAVISVFVGLFFIIFIALLFTNPTIPFQNLMFELSSAFGTVGLSVPTLSTSTTSQLNIWGRLLIILVMFIGRLGPLTIAFAIGKKNDEAQYHYPRERIYVG